ncbi:D-2-hydroxyacid dehydrogenase family protein [Aureimonas sp. ME7]|uniref:D-2-hydroxyacid dehydrogenase family protein n=1 Tax=Aureimonas sp. ME7 TaxID=2744252 RepID=UPI0015F45D7F|nr:D-2-hydroxyacid dehydrogenase family protein [Aureimonas sp. ME7]
MRIAVLDDYQRVATTIGGWDRLPSSFEVVPFHDHVADADGLVARLSNFDIVCAMRERTPLPAAVIERVPRLKLIVTSGGRNASIDVTAAASCGVTVCGTEGSGPATAELAVALLLESARDLSAEMASVRAGGWQVGVGRTLAGKTLGVLGLGRLGSKVARIGAAMDMEILAWSQNLTAGRAKEVGATLVGRDELFRRADYLTVHLVLSERTRGLVGERELGLMKPDAALVNTSRAAIVDTPALLRALAAGRLRRAALDVFDSEPLPPSDPIRDTPGVVATPHIGYVTRETYEAFFSGYVEAILGFVEGRPIRVLSPG